MNKILNIYIVLFVVLTLNALGVEDGVAINLKNNTIVSIQSTEVNSIYDVTSEDFQSNFENDIQLLRKKVKDGIVVLKQKFY